MIRASQFKKYKEDQAAGNFTRYKKAREDALEYCRNQADSYLSRGYKDFSLWMDKVPMPMDRYFFNHSFYPAIVQLIDELQAAGYYVKVDNLGGWLYEYCTINVRTEPNLWERLAQWFSDIKDGGLIPPGAL